MRVAALFSCLCLVLTPRAIVCQRNGTLRVHVICDKEMTNAFPSSESLNRYVYAFFNAVNLILTNNDMAKIWIDVQKIEDARGEHWWLSEITLNGNAVSVPSTTKKLQEFSRRPGYNESHILFLLTKRGITTHWKNHTLPGWQQPSLSLPAFPRQGSLCANDSIIIEQDGGKLFDGVLFAARRIAHLVGAPYDVRPGYMEDCSYNRFNLMGNTSKVGTNSYEFSSCTKNALYNAIPEIPSKCADRNSGTTVGGNRTILPADIILPDEYCKIIYAHQPNPGVCSDKYRGANSYLGAECRVKCCYASDFWKPLIRLPPALDGYPCGTSGQICVNKRCR